MVTKLRASQIQGTIPAAQLPTIPLANLAQGGAVNGDVMEWSTTANSWGAPPLVMQSKSNKIASGTSCAITLDSTPKVGNILVMFVGNETGNTPSVTGFTSRDSQTLGDPLLTVLTRTVQSGDGKTYTVTQGSSDSMSATLVELPSTVTSPTTWTYHHDATGSGGTVNSTVTVASGTLLLVFFTSIGGSSNGVTGFTANYTDLGSEIPAFHTGKCGYTVATGSSQTITTVADGTPAPCLQTIVELT